ncbi:hypothetical protein EV175_005201 [Coemansia sp. RSA 1933]|nr:hypothetical protein EV175_005201 [Coemansia sp. RSA 1933]
MSGSFEAPWLSAIILKHASKFGESLNHGTRRVQIFKTRHSPNDRSFYKHTCEVSDKFEFMRAAFSPKALESQKIQDLSSLEHIIVQIRSFKLMFYSGIEKTAKLQSRKKNRQKQKLSRISRSVCPERIAKAGAPQIWLIITDFTCLGGAENEIFGEPVYINTNTKIADLTNTMLVEARIKAQKGDVHQTASFQDSSEAHVAANKRIATELLRANDGNTDTGSSKRQRHDSANDASDGGNVFPTIRSVPFMSDFDAMWSCEPLWQSLIVKHMSIPVMVVWNMLDDASDHDSEFHEEGGYEGQERQSEQQQQDTRNVAMAAHSSIDNCEISKHSDRPAIAPTLNNCQSTSDLLGGLLISDDEGLMSSNDIMERMYGTIPIDDEFDDHMDANPSDDSKDAADGRYDASSVLQSNSPWNQDSGFSIR